MVAKNRSEKNNISPRKSLVLAAFLLATGYTTSSPEIEATPPTTTPSSEVRVPGITIYEDPAFTKPLGEVASFAIVCADYKDPLKRSLHPSQVIRYKVQEEIPSRYHPPLAGYVDPAQHPATTGTAPAC